MPPRRIAPIRAAPAALAALLLGACAATPDLRGRPPAAVLEVRASAARLASCLADAYAADPFRLEVDSAGRGVRITADGAPGHLAPWWRRPRFEVEVADTGPGTAEVVLRTVPTLLGPEAEVARLRRRAAACADAASGVTFRSIAGAPRRVSASCSERWVGAIPSPEPPRSAAALRHRPRPEMTAFLPRRRAFVAVTAAALSLAVAGPALAHSEVHHSEPADGAVLGLAPPAIVIMFHQPVRVMTLRLLDEAGHEKKLAREGARTAAVQEVRATVQDRLPSGGYRVEWRGSSEDGHVGGGAIAFRVEPGAR